MSGLTRTEELGFTAWLAFRELACALYDLGSWARGAQHEALEGLAHSEIPAIVLPDEAVLTQLVADAHEQIRRARVAQRVYKRALEREAHP